MDLFNKRLVHENIWAIAGSGHDLMHLVLGSQCALLVDTGLGIGDLPAVVRGITDLPVIVVNTHGHPDHAGGNSNFDSAWLHPNDEQIMRRMCSYEYRRQDVLAAGGESGVDTAPLLAGMVRDKPYRLEALEADQVFDLGNRQFEVMEIPGHTPGSVCLLNKKEDLLFTGDTVVATPVWVYLKHSTPLGVYLASLESLKARANESTIIFPGHEPTPLNTKHLDELIICAGEILQSPGRGVPARTFAGEGILWKHNDAAIIYDPKKL